MLEVVNDAFDLSSNIGVTLAEKMRVAKTWSRVLFGIIPEDKLPQTFNYAFQNHQSAFPVNAYDLKVAWSELQVQENTEKLRIAEEVKTENPSLFCPRRHEHIGEPARVKIVNFFNPAEELEVPCKDCRLKAYDAWRTRFVAEHKGEKIQTGIDPLSLVKPVDQPKPIIADNAWNICKNCNTEIKEKSAAYRVNVNFYVCRKCNNEIQSL